MQSKTDATPAEDRVPQLAPDLDPAALSLTPAEGYLLSRVDGRTPWKLLREIGGLTPEEVDRCLDRWLGEGLIRLPEKRRGAGSGASGDLGPPPRVDAKLEIPVEVQRRILEYETRLGSPYHEILGISRDAGQALIKKAYFTLSKEFHPDRYFRREIGPFAKRLERVFKKIVEAYELLSDPTARAELERSLGPQTPAAPAAPSKSDRDGPPRKPLAFSIHNRVIQQRKLKAKRLFEAGTAAFARERWTEAAGSVRLAIAFDPWNEAYKERFVDIQLRVHQERACQLVAQAEEALDMRELAEALRLINEALHYRPHDADLLHRAARLAWVTGGDLHKAKMQAQESCELEPDVGRYRRTLGQIYKAAGLDANARRELEAALRLDPNDQEAEDALRSFGRGILSSLTLGGKR